MKLLDYLKDNILIFDGAMGTMLQAAGLSAGEIPESYNITNPDIVENIHKSYVEAGADIITANTFQANEFKLKDSGFSVEEIIEKGVALAKKSGAKYVALDIGPLGQLMKPMGTLSFEKAYDAFKKQIVAGKAAGADVVLLETAADILEVKAAVLAVRENSDLPIFVSLSYQQDGRTFVGCDPKTAAVALSALNVDALGVNCSLGPKELENIVDVLLEYSTVPVLVQPNAGLPKMRDGETVYDVTPDEYGKYICEFAKKGAAVLGGCCGTTPDFTKEVCEKLRDRKRTKTAPKNVTAITSGTKTVEFDNNITVIGERINPTGKKLLKEKLREKDFNYIMSEAIKQSENGADVLDVNCGLPEIDESAVLKRAVEEIQAVVNLPLEIDSSDAWAIENAVRIYRGKPIINSVCGKKESMAAIFPIVKKYGTAVVALTLDENGIPETAEERVKIAERIIKTAETYGIDKKDIIVDCLVLTASAQQAQVKETIKAVNLMKDLGVKTVLGISNVSFGLPNRPLLNSVFLGACFGAGLDSAIINPMSDAVMDTVRAFRVLNNTDKDANEYIPRYAEITEKVVQKTDADLKTLIETGQREEAASVTKELIKAMTAMEIIDEFIIPALNVVGDKYEKGIVFLPQLMQSAESAKAAFDVIKAKSGQVSVSKGKVLLATVEGDIHDIGKNIARMLLENYGYQVVDLGRSVPAAEIVKAAKEQDIKLIGLSALMTTTVQSMKETIDALKSAGLSVKVMVGGAVLSPEYADFVGADFYVPDAKADVKIADEFFKVVK